MYEASGGMPIKQDRSEAARLARKRDRTQTEEDRLRDIRREIAREGSNINQKLREFKARVREVVKRPWLQNNNTCLRHPSRQLIGC